MFMGTEIINSHYLKKKKDANDLLWKLLRSSQCRQSLILIL